MADNPFLMSGPGGIPLPRPIATSAGLAPAVMQMARDFAKEGVNFASGVAGEKGLLTGSGYANTLANAYLRGQNQAIGVYQQQQSLYNQYAQQLMAMRAAAGPKRKKSMFGQIMDFAMPIASLGLGFAQLGGGGAASKIAGGMKIAKGATAGDSYLESIGQSYIPKPDPDKYLASLGQAYVPL